MSDSLIVEKINAAAALQLAAGAAPVVTANGTRSGEDDSWKPVDLEAVVRGLLAGEIVGPVPSLLPRADGACLLYPGELHSFAAEPESGKSWIMQAETVRLINAGEHVLYLDFEDSPASIAARLLALGGEPDAVRSFLTLVRPEESLSPGQLVALLAGRQYALAVIDGVTEAMGLLSLEIGANDDVSKFRKLLARPIAATGAAVVEIDHVVKDDKARGRFAIGAQHKLAGVAVAYSIHPISRPSRTRAGTLKIVVEKDRHGCVREHEDSHTTIALARIEPQGNGRVRVTLNEPDATASTGEFRPTRLMAKIGDYIEGNPGATRNEVTKGVTGRTDAKDQALRCLVAEGFVRREQDRQAQRHFHVKPFAEDPTAPLLPNRSQAAPREQAQPTAPPVPPPYGGDRAGERSPEEQAA